MNIQITPFNITGQIRNVQNKKEERPAFRYQNLAPLAMDTVSFCGKSKRKIIEDDDINEMAKAKNLDNEKKRTNRVSYEVCRAVNEESQLPYRKFINTLRNGLKNAVESPNHPDNPILPGKAGIYGRVKRTTSIKEKVPPRSLKNKQEIFEMGDVIGTRVILKRTTKKDFDTVFKELGKMVVSGKLNVLEVENYRLSPEESYVSEKTLDNFENACIKAGQHPEIKKKPRESGYTAIHMTVKLPDGKYAEIQIMGRDMEQVKELEDFYYKWSQNKSIDDKYRPIQDMCREVLGKADKDGNFKKLDAFQNATFKQYIIDSYKHAREIPPKSSKKREIGKDYFLPIPYSLPQELDFANLHEMKELCERSLIPAKIDWNAQPAHYSKTQKGHKAKSVNA